MGTLQVQLLMTNFLSLCFIFYQVLSTDSSTLCTGERVQGVWSTENSYF